MKVLEQSLKLTGNYKDVNDQNGLFDSLSKLAVIC